MFAHRKEKASEHTFLARKNRREVEVQALGTLIAGEYVVTPFLITSVVTFSRPILKCTHVSVFGEKRAKTECTLTNSSLKTCTLEFLLSVT